MRSDSTTQTPSVGEYRSFLVRLWQSRADGGWRASAQSIQTGILAHFTDLEGLYAFLDAEARRSHRQETYAATDFSISPAVRSIPGEESPGAAAVGDDLLPDTFDGE